MDFITLLNLPTKNMGTFIRAVLQALDDQVVSLITSGGIVYYRDQKNPYINMKKLVIAMIALTGSVVVANAQEGAQDSASTPSAAVAPAEEGRVLIKTDELPEAVKKTLDDQEYKGWIINAAYHNRKEERFEVELKNGTESQLVKFSEEGQRLDD
jgi:hypothetical protein